MAYSIFPTKYRKLAIFSTIFVSDFFNILFGEFGHSVKNAFSPRFWLGMTPTVQSHCFSCSVWFWPSMRPAPDISIFNVVCLSATNKMVWIYAKPDIAFVSDAFRRLIEVKLIGKSVSSCMRSIKEFTISIIGGATHPKPTAFGFINQLPKSIFSRSESGKIALLRTVLGLKSPPFLNLK